MAQGFIVAKVLCENCMKRITGPQKCQCEHPQPRRFETRIMAPLKLSQPAQVREAVPCAL